MSKDFGSGKGGVQKSSSTERTPKQSGTPKTGFSQAPKGEELRGGPGPGKRGGGKKIS